MNLLCVYCLTITIPFVKSSPRVPFTKYNKYHVLNRLDFYPCERTIDVTSLDKSLQNLLFFHLIPIMTFKNVLSS